MIRLFDRVAALVFVAFVAAWQPALADPASCQLVTKSDVESVLHVTVGNGNRMQGGGADVCIYGVASLAAGRSSITQYDAMIANMAKLGPTTGISGFGEKANYVLKGHQLIVYAKGYVVNVSVRVAGPLNDPTALSQAKELMRRALARL
jgi:hypothetical protein